MSFKTSTIRRSMSVNFGEGQIFHSTPRQGIRFGVKSKLFRDSKNPKMKSKLSIDSDWSIVSDDSSVMGGLPTFTRRSNISLNSLREQSLTRLSKSKSKIASKIKKAKNTLQAKFKRSGSKTSIQEDTSRGSYMTDSLDQISCKTIYHHILSKDQEYVEEYDLVIWEENYKKEGIVQKLKKLRRK